jgi:uncharacterized protein YggE
MEKPDTITVAVTHRDEVGADKVDIHVTVKGTSLITGPAALRKAKEVSQLVSALEAVGIKDSDLKLKSVHAENSGGILSKFSLATYQLRIRCSALDNLAEVLGAVTSQKNARLDFLAWRYPDDKNLRNEWLRTCLEEAREKAAAIASTLGVQLLGVHSLVERWVDSEQGGRAPLSEMPGGVRVREMARAEPIDLGFPLSHSKWVELQLEIQFRVSELKP